ncbi:hypothetical protein J2W42_002217 [Rhizobium tibeticum]|uniref:hypothetical protein n=1 Tax=Rhizobium tibeticum TaxID=501024 RepID=UPI002785244A|nr:hypothetical protein [Rhizobium tibeticum]MDP9809369.1 hypothetical protein [Rhizobium tibeticum]
MTDDDELFAEISAVADKAANDAPHQYDLKAVATTLAQRFKHRSVDEIETQAKAVWQARGLFWRD